MEQHTNFPQVRNFRDVGKTVNLFLGERRIREGLFYRSARLDEATPDDKRLIRDDLNIRTIIDLRTETEILKQAEKHKARLDTADSPDAAAESPEPHHIDGLDYRGIKITGKSFETHLLRQLPWWDLFKAIILYMLGYRIHVARIMSRQVMLPRGLVGLGLDVLDHSGSEICEALSLYTTPWPLPSIVHCTQGKDRTGLVCALILMILGIPRPAIEHDYFLTDAALQQSREEMLVEINEIGLPDDWAGTAGDMIVAIEKHLKETYGGLEEYLDQISFGPLQRSQIRETLLY